MFNAFVLQSVLTGAILLIVVAAQAPADDLLPPGSTLSHRVAPTDVRWTDVKDVTLEELPAIPSRKNRRLRAWPKWAEPRFGWVQSPEYEKSLRFPFTYLPSARVSRNWGSEQLNLGTSDGSEDFVEHDPLVVAAPPARLSLLASSDRNRSEAKIDVELLSQRIEAHNLSVAAVETLLQRHDWNLRQIESVASRIELLANDHEQWELYREALQQPQRDRVGLMASLLPSLEKLRQRVFESRVAIDVDPTSFSSLPKKTAERRLTQIDARVQSLLQTRPSRAR